MIKSIINECHKPITAYIGSKQVWQYFSPAELFANGEQGVWFDPSDLSTMFQDVDGTEPVTKDGDPVGLILDKSQGLESGGMHFKTVKGGFNSSEWVLKPENIDSSGRLVLRPSSQIVYKTTKPLLKNKTYKIEVEIDESIGVNHGIRLYFTSVNMSGVYDHLGYFKEKGVYTFYISLSSLEEGYLGIGRIGSHTGEVYINSVSVTEVKGNHAIQETASARPIYKTDGILHWLQADGVDDFLDTLLVPWNGSSFFQSSAVAITGGQQYLGIFRFLREGGDPTATTHNYLEEYTSSIAPYDRRVVFQRYPSPVSMYNNTQTMPTRDTNLVSWSSNNAESFKSQVIPKQPSLIDVGVRDLASGNATLSLFRGHKGDLMAGRMYGFIWVSDTVSDENRDKANNYLMNKSGVTL